MSKFPGWGSIFNKKSNNTNSQEVSSLFKNVSLNENAPLQQVPNQENIVNQSPKATQSYEARAEDNAPNYVIGMDPNRKTYRYTGNDEYLNEEGRDHDHLYIGPGEPLVSQKTHKAPVKRPHYQNTYGIDDLNNQVSQNISNPQSYAESDRSQINQDSYAPFDNSKQNYQYQEESYPQQIQSKAFVAPYLSNDAADKFEDVPRKAQNNNEAENLKSDAFVANEDIYANKSSASSSMFNNDRIPPKIDPQKEHQETPQGKELITSKLKAFLFIRQLLASFFTHTTLSMAAPKLSLSFGPTYPSSMPLPYFFVGLILGTVCFLFNNTTATIIYLAPFILVIFLLLTGIQGFRGCSALISIFSKRRADSYIKILTVFIISVLFCFCIDVCFTYKLCDLRFGLVLASILMLSAYTATSMNFSLDGDPVDSYGALSLKGLLVAGGICLIILALSFSVALVISLIGISLLIRMIIGFYLHMHKARVSRDIICATQYITMLTLLMDMLLLHLKFNLPIYSYLINNIN